MRILDWRHGGEKWLVRRWRRTAAEGAAPGPAARAWEALHDRLVARRVAGRPAPPEEPLVVSIGNLALGGTGKTPVVGDTARRLAARGIAGAIVTRGFGSRLPGPLVVSPDNAAAGDEARLLARGLAGTGWRVVQARDRAAGLAAAVAAGAAPRVVLLEDGHQTAGVGRHLDALILDRWQVAPGPDGPEVVPGTGPVFPFGPWREGAVGAARAGLWLVESGDEVPVRGRGGAQVLGFRRVGRLVTVGENAHLPARPVLVSGIARPERFEAEATGLLSAAPVLAVRLEDHASYGTDARARIVAAVREAGGDGVVTTAKDWVKLAGGWPADLAAAVVDLELVWGNDQTPADVIGGRLV